MTEVIYIFEFNRDMIVLSAKRMITDKTTKIFIT